MANTCDPKNVKSAFRALEILEFFSGGESSTTVTEISRRYAYPQSSTSELMNCLVALGYLRRDERGRRFLPTSRLATIGAWVQPRLFRQGGLLAAMDEIASSTGCATVLAGYNMSRLQYLHVVGSAELRADVTAEDGALALLRTAEGRAMLATFSDSYARGLVHRLNSEVDEPYRVRFADLQEERNAFSRSGYVTVRDPAGRSGVA
ncbi:MAG: helix-turn-helix domain-containing protein [Sphingomonas sp.]